MVIAIALDQSLAKKLGGLTPYARLKASLVRTMSKQCRLVNQTLEDCKYFFLSSTIFLQQ